MFYFYFICVYLILELLHMVKINIFVPKSIQVTGFWNIQNTRDSKNEINNSNRQSFTNTAITRTETP